MALLDILVYPDPRLRNKAAAIEVFDESVTELVANMTQTMYAAPGIGLAAIQVNVPHRVVVIDISDDRSDLKVFVNPEIIEMDGEQNIDEGCLSLPGIYAPVERAENIVVRARNEKGEPFELRAEGLLAVCIQHEIDHLDGKVFVDYLSRMKRDRIRRRLEKEARKSDVA